jgi:carboxyl-terminal processing protease
VLPELRKRSEARVASDQDFTFLRDEIERFKKMREEKTVSMNEEERRNEKKENEARAEARKKELRARPLPNYKTYELTLKNVGLPGLPPPMARTNVTIVASGASTNVLRSKVTNSEGKLETLTNVMAKASGDDDELNDDADVSAPDITLDEGRRILQDLVALTPKGSSLAGSVTVNERVKQ